MTSAHTDTCSRKLQLLDFTATSSRTLQSHTTIGKGAYKQGQLPLFNHCKLAKIRHPFLHTILRQKWGEGICLNINFVSCIRPSHRSSHNCATTAAAFCSFDESVPQEISGTCVETKPRGIIVSDKRGRLHVSSRFQWTAKTLAVASQRGCVRVYKHNRRQS